MPHNWIISDTHFGHGNIIELGKRPFEHVEEMNNAMIDAWNDKVGRDDFVIHLGDFGWRNTDYNLEIMSRLRFGKLVLVCGNHDSSRSLTAYHKLGVQIQDYLEVKTPRFGGKLCCFHYPIHEWNGFFRGAIHAHGHTHSAVYSEVPGRYNLCVEAIGYAPKLITDLENEHAEVVEHMKESHHGNDNHHLN